MYYSAPRLLPMEGSLQMGDMTDDHEVPLLASSGHEEEPVFETTSSDTDDDDEDLEAALASPAELHAAIREESVAGARRSAGTMLGSRIIFVLNLLLMIPQVTYSPTLFDPNSILFDHSSQIIATPIIIGQHPLSFEDASEDTSNTACFDMKMWTVGSAVRMALLTVVICVLVRLL